MNKKTSYASLLLLMPIFVVAITPGYNNLAFAEALMGHKSLKLVYYKQSTQERLNMYKKLEPYLTISDFSKVEKTIDEMKVQIESLTNELEKVKQWREISVKYQRKNY